MKITITLHSHRFDRDRELCLFFWPEPHTSPPLPNFPVRTEWAFCKCGRYAPVKF